jgi:hypothetical protein
MRVGSTGLGRALDTPSYNHEMEISDGGARIIFEDVVDLRLAAAFQRLNTFAFDGSLPPTEVRWAKLSAPEVFCFVYGRLVDKHEALAGPFIFLNEKLQETAMFLFAELGLLHEMCHYKVAGHDPAFTKELLRALQRVSWEPLVGTCVPNFKIEELGG